MENIYSTDWDSDATEPGYTWHRIRLARRLGGQKLGGSIYVLGPGQKSFPYHFHHANEEMLVVIEGEVTIRTPEGEQPAVAGDALVFPVGPSGAHQVINTSESEARILMLSTMVEPEIAEYPDSGHVGVMGGVAPGAPGEGRLFKFLDGTAEVEYWSS